MTLRLNGDSSGFTEIKAADAAGDNSIKLPASNGSANELLKNGSTAGELEFASDVCVDSSSRLLVGTTSFTGEASIVVEGSSAGGNTQAQLWLNRGQTDPTTDNVLGQIIFGDATASGSNGAMIQARADSSWGGANGNATRLAFFTESQGSDDGPSERLRITNNGTISLLDSPGINFSGIQTNAAAMDSETLNGYETGGFSPTVGGHSSMGTITYNTGSTYGRYIRVGHYVTIMGQVVVTNVSSSPSGNFRLRGLPFTPLNNSVTSRGIGVITTENGGVDYVHLCIRGAFTDGNGLVGCAVTLKPSQTNDDGFVEPNSSTFITNTFVARFSLTYKMA